MLKVFKEVGRTRSCPLVDQIANDQQKPLFSSSLDSEEYFSHKPQPIELDVGGRMFKTTLQTLTSAPNSFFDKIFSRYDWSLAMTQSDQYSTSSALFIDRDGNSFHYILEYMRHGKNILLPHCVETRVKVREEAVAYGLLGLTDIIDGMVTLRFTDSSHRNSKDITLKLSDLRSVAGSRLGRAFGGDLKSLQKDESGRYLIHRDNYESAVQVAQFLITGQLDNNRNKYYYRSEYVKYLKELKAEAEHFEIPQMITKVEEMMKQV